jgi:hypothetical protein
MIFSVFIHRPRLAIVISIAGVIALGALPVAQFPDIVPPQVGVTATYPGALAAAVEESVAQVIEAQVNGVDKMIYMKSTSGGDGSYSLNVSFPGSAATPTSTQSTSPTGQPGARSAAIRGSAQRRHNQEGVDIAIASGCNLFAQREPRRAVSVELRQAQHSGHLEAGAGRRRRGPVGRSRIFDADLVNLDRMASLDITPADVVNAINSQNTQAAVGHVGAAPLVPEVEFQLNISTQGRRLTTVEEFNNIIVRAAADGGVVRIKDIARAELGSKSADSLVRYNGRPGEAIFINQSPGANAIAVAAGDRGCPAAFPRGDDDVLRLHRGIGAAGHRLGRRCRDDTRGRNCGLWWNGRRQLSRDIRDPWPLCIAPVSPGTDQEPVKGEYADDTSAHG